MILLQRRTFDVAKRREIIYDIQRHIAQHAYALYDASQKVVSAWEPYVKNWSPTTLRLRRAVDGRVDRA